MEQVRTIITDAMSKIGAINFGENPDSDSASLCLRQLKKILSEFSIRFRNYKQYDYSVSASSIITLGTDTSNILLPISGNIAERPATITNVNYITGNITYPLSVKTHEEYSQIALKQILGIPDTAYIEYGFPYVTLYVFPIPSMGGTVQIIGKSYMAPEDLQINSYLEIPREYDAMVESTLALRIAPYFGVTAGQDLIAQAASDQKHVAQMNFARSITTCKSDFTNNNGTGNILGRY